MSIQPANRILQQEKSKPNFTAECVGSLEACWWPSLAVCCEPGIAGALFPLFTRFPAFLLECWEAAEQGKVKDAQPMFIPLAGAVRPQVMKFGCCV